MFGRRSRVKAMSVNNDLPIVGPNVLPPLDEFRVRVVPVPAPTKPSPA